MAKHVEWVEIFTDFFCQYFPDDPLLLQLVNDRFFAIGVLPLAGKVIQRGIFFEQCFAGVIFKGFGNQFTVGVVILNTLRNNAHCYTVDVKLADFLLVFFRKWADIIGIGNLVWWRRRFINACYLFVVMFADFFEFLFKIRVWIGDILWCGIHDFFGNAIETLIGKGSKQLTMDLVNVERVKEYAAEDADVTLQLKQALYPMIEQIGLQHLYFEIEEPMIAVLADIEMAGVRIDSGALTEYSVELSRRLAELEAQIRTEAGESTLNINSARQLGEVLFAKMRIAEKPKMTKTKQFCTDEDYLQTFARKHRIVDLILEYRGVKKLLSTYVEALPQLVNRTTGRIHTSFNQAVTATGRLSSTNPNLQNIPVREEMGRRIRRAFIPSDSDHLLLSADYSQVELRLMAHLSGDESLIAAFAHGEDIHAATAAKLFNKTLGEVTSEERRRAKTANFGIIYGISAFGLSQRLEIPRKEAKDIIDGYFESYPKVKEYMDDVVAKAKEEGFVSTIFGRRRYLNDISSHNAVARGLAERNAVNAPIQGSAADIMKIAMINVHRRFAAEGIRSKVILQVHDELVVDMLRSEQERVAAIVTECMESAAALKVRLVVDYGVGDNWLEAH